MGSYTFSPTDVSNYPIQGTAADIVAVFRAKLYRALINLEDDALTIVPICTVHDSVVFDCATDEDLELLIAVLDCLMQNLNALLRELFPALKTPLQLKLDVKAGIDWMEQAKIASLPTGGFA
jgi:DNA polymerase I-like protein with 3'-5' exonuclease and polymerase domains